MIFEILFNPGYTMYSMNHPTGAQVHAACKANGAEKPLWPLGEGGFATTVAMRTELWASRGCLQSLGLLIDTAWPHGYFRLFEDSLNILVWLNTKKAFLFLCLQALQGSKWRAGHSEQGQGGGGGGYGAAFSLNSTSCPLESVFCCCCITVSTSHLTMDISCTSLCARRIHAYFQDGSYSELDAFLKFVVSVIFLHLFTLSVLTSPSWNRSVFFCFCFW